MTPIRWARYSADPCKSDIISASGTFIFDIEATEKSFSRAFSISKDRNTPVFPAPVIDTRALFSRIPIKTPTIAYLDAGFGNFLYAAFIGKFNFIATINSSSLRLVSKKLSKKSLAFISRKLVIIVASSPRHIAG